MYFRRAFSLLEVIFVLVILAIISTMGFDIVLKTYQNYQRAFVFGNLQTQSDTALKFIASKLSFRIKALTSIGDAKIDWVGYDYEAHIGEYNGTDFVGWNGFCDLNSSTKSTIISAGSDFFQADNVLKGLGKSDGILNSRVFFKQTDYTPYVVTSFTQNSLSITPQASEISEHYYISSYDYAVEKVGDDLIYTYGAQSVPLVQNVSSFVVWKVGQVIRLKLCIFSNDEQDFSICKEKAVL